MCPWNKFSIFHNEKEFYPNQKLQQMTKDNWIEMTEETFKIIFKNSAIQRTKFKGIKKNIRAVLNKK